MHGAESQSHEHDAAEVRAQSAPGTARIRRNEYWEDDYQDTDDCNAKDLEYPCTTGLSTKPKAPQFSFGIRPKVLTGQKERLDVPGPGSYYHTNSFNIAKYTKTPQFSFGSAARQDPKKQRVPGPGAYVQKPAMGCDGPGFSCTPRRQEGFKRGKVPPGPGAHNIPGSIGKIAPSSIGKTTPRHTMTPRRENELFKAHNKTPGPGDYDYLDKHTAGVTAQWGFGSAAQRPKALIETIDPTPGPGAYGKTWQEQPGSGPKFSMRARTAGTKERLAKF